MAEAFRRLEVAPGARRYDILIGAGLLKRAGELIAPVLSAPRVIIISDDTVTPLYRDTLCASLKAKSIAYETISLTPGESSKSFESFESLINQLLDLSPDRATTLIAIGGGVVGDLTGFAASVLLRGVGVIQIPTTLLSQVDSSVGGKTGINTHHGKNLVGTFHQPRLVLIDTDTLKTLPRRHWQAGYAEIVKYGLIANRDFFAWLERNLSPMMSGDTEALTEAIHTSCATKAAIVEKDEREASTRALLNFGHTFGHALEAETKYSGALLHGEAVSIGMMLATRLSEQMGLCEAVEVEAVMSHLKKSGLPVSLGEVKGVEWNIDALIHHMRRDKKAYAGNFAFVLLRGIGEAFVSRDVSEDQLRALLSA